MKKNNKNQKIRKNHLLISRKFILANKDERILINGLRILAFLIKEGKYIKVFSEISEDKSEYFCVKVDKPLFSKLFNIDIKDTHHRIEKGIQELLKKTIAVVDRTDNEKIEYYPYLTKASPKTNELIVMNNKIFNNTNEGINLELDKNSQYIRVLLKLFNEKANLSSNALNLLMLLLTQRMFLNISIKEIKEKLGFYDPKKKKDKREKYKDLWNFRNKLNEWILEINNLDKEYRPIIVKENKNSQYKIDKYFELLKNKNNILNSRIIIRFKNNYWKNY